MYQGFAKGDGAVIGPVTAAQALHANFCETSGTSGNTYEVIDLMTVFPHSSFDLTLMQAERNPSSMWT